MKPLPKLQIHIGGSTRTGKSTLARLLKRELEQRGGRPVIIDVDETRTRIFKLDEPPLGSQLQKIMQAWTYSAVWGFRIPDILDAGGIPIFTATHAHPDTYRQAEAVANERRALLQFLLLETTSYEELVRRCLADTESCSDMHDPEKNLEERKNWEDITARIRQNYGPGFTKPHLCIPQGTPEAMAARALAYILDGTGMK